MTKSQIESFAVGHPYPTDWVETILKLTRFDLEMAGEILCDKEKTKAIIQSGTIMSCGITLCCDYNFGIAVSNEKLNRKINYCPICGRKIVVRY